MRAILLAVGIAAALVASPAAATIINFASLQAAANSPGGLTYQRARAAIPGLQQVTFEKADRNRDGVITGSEFPAFQSIINAMYSNR